MSKRLVPGELVWAKVRMCPYWPARVAAPPRGTFRNNYTYVFFFGSDNYGWVRNSDICFYGSEIKINPSIRNALYIKAGKEIARLHHEKEQEKLKKSQKKHKSQSKLLKEAVAKYTKINNKLSEVMALNRQLCRQLKAKEKELENAAQKIDAFQQEPRKANKMRKDQQGNLAKMSEQTKKDKTKIKKKIQKGLNSKMAVKKGAKNPKTKGKSSKSASGSRRSSSSSSSCIISVHVSEAKLICPIEPIILVDRLM